MLERMAKHDKINKQHDPMYIYTLHACMQAEEWYIPVSGKMCTRGGTMCSPNTSAVRILSAFKIMSATGNDIEVVQTPNHQRLRHDA